MLTPLYPIANLPATITVVAPGALAGATSIPVEALTVALPAGYRIKFGADRFAELTAAAAVDTEALTVAALGLDITAGLTATVPGSQASTLLGGSTDKWAKLPSDAVRTAMHLDAEMILELDDAENVYTGTDADKLAYAVAHQLLFMLEHGLTPSLVKSSSQGGPSPMTKVYRDRWIDPTAASIVARVTGRRAVRFEPPFMAGV
jgi:hypothetical protein